MSLLYCIHEEVLTVYRPDLKHEINGKFIAVSNECVCACWDIFRYMQQKISYQLVFLLCAHFTILPSFVVCFPFVLSKLLKANLIYSLMKTSIEILWMNETRRLLLGDKLCLMSFATFDTLFISMNTAIKLDI